MGRSAELAQRKQSLGDLMIGGMDWCWTCSKEMLHSRTGGIGEGLVESSNVESEDPAGAAAGKGNHPCCGETEVEISAWLGKPGPLAGKHSEVRTGH